MPVPRFVRYDRGKDRALARAGNFPLSNRSHRVSRPLVVTQAVLDFGMHHALDLVCKVNWIRIFLVMKFTTQHVPYWEYSKIRIVNFIARKFHLNSLFISDP